jgi:dimethylargininase
MEMVNGLRKEDLGRPDYFLALQQHSAYTAALEKCRCNVISLPPDPHHPDSVFVEDTAVIAGELAVIARPGADSRRGETTSIRSVLENYFSRIEEIDPPGTLDAGDVLEVEDHFFIGLSRRTNREGAAQLSGILGEQGKTAGMVPLDSLLHLKSGVSYLGNDTLLLAGELRECEEFRDYNKIDVPEDEEYAANSILVNEKVLMPAGFPKTRKTLMSLCYDILPVDTSEYRKLDGGLSCLSLRF